jgi:hypothetical protein
MLPISVRRHIFAPVKHVMKGKKEEKEAKDKR